MPKRTAKQLTDLGIKRLTKAPRGKRLELSDTTPGLVLRVTDKGTKSFAVYYRWADPETGWQKNTRLTLGDFDTLGIEEARGKARRIRSWVKQGIDPKVKLEAEAATERTKAEDANRALRTFGTVAENYIRRETPRLAIGRSYQRTIERELIPAWGRLPAANLRRRHLTELTDGILDDGRPAVAFRAHEIAKRIFSWALDRGDVEAHPFAGMRPPIKKQARARVLDDDELRALWGAWETVGYPFGALQRLLLLTGQRRAEVAEMSWSELDLEAATWVIPADRSKSRREHVVPLSTTALDLLEALPRFEEGDFVFTSRAGERPVSGFSKAKELATRESRVTGWRHHDLRRTCRTRLAALGVPEIVAERVLNHVPAGLSRVYNVHDYEAEKAEALEAWADALRLIVNPPAKVVRLRQTDRPGAA